MQIHRTKTVWVETMNVYFYTFLLCTDYKLSDEENAIFKVEYDVTKHLWSLFKHNGWQIHSTKESQCGFKLIAVKQIRSLFDKEPAYATMQWTITYSVLCHTMSCFHVISISLISSGDYPCAHYFFVDITPVCTTFMFHDSLWHHNGSWCC